MFCGSAAERASENDLRGGWYRVVVLRPIRLCLVSLSCPTARSGRTTWKSHLPPRLCISRSARTSARPGGFLIWTARAERQAKTAELEAGSLSGQHAVCMQGRGRGEVIIGETDPPGAALCLRGCGTNFPIGRVHTMRHATQANPRQQFGGEVAPVSLEMWWMGQLS